MKSFLSICLLALVALPLGAQTSTIGALPNASAVAAADDFACDQGASTRACTAAQIAAYVLTLIDTEVELEAVVTDISNIIAASEIDTEAELEALLSDVTDIITDSESAASAGQLDDGDYGDILSSSGVLAIDAAAVVISNLVDFGVPAQGDVIVVSPAFGDTETFGYVTPDAGTNLTADLEEEGVTCTDCVDVGNIDDNNSPTDEYCLTYESDTSDFAWQVCGSGVVDADYVVLSTDATLTDERVLTAGDAIALTDAGAGSTATLDVDIIDDGDAQSATTSSESGFEVVSGEIGLVRGCSDGQVLKWDETNGDWDCAADSSGGGGTPNVLDLADDASDESTDLVEIATTGDTNSIFTNPSADKLLINLGNDWPKADSADQLEDADYGDVSSASGSITLDADVVAAAEMADADHGDVSWASGVATVENVQCAGECVGSGEIAANSIDDYEIAADSITLESIEDSAHTPTAGDFVIVDTGDNSLDYLTPNGGTNIAVDLEEDSHATEHDGTGISVSGETLNIDLIDDGDAQSATAASESGLEHVGGELGLLRGCADTEVLVWDDTEGDWSCGAGGGGGSSEWTDAGSHIYPTETTDDVRVDSIQDVDGPGTNWSIDSSGNAAFASIAVDPSSTPIVDFDDVDDAGANPDASIVVDCPTANDCDMSIAVNSGADSETVVLKLDTTDAGATTVQVGAPGTNYVNVSEAGVMSFVGSADLDLPDDSVDEADLRAVNAAVDEDIVTYEATTGDFEYHTFAELAPVESKCVYIEDPVTDEELLSIWRAGATVTISEIWCEVTAGTSVDLDLEVDDGTPAGVNGSDITCTTSGVADSTLAGDTEVADGETLDLDLGTVTGSVTSLTVCWEF